MRTRTRRVVALATAVPILALSMGAGGKNVRAAPSDETSQKLQLAEAPPGLARNRKGTALRFLFNFIKNT